VREPGEPEPFVQYLCAFCNNVTDDEPRYVSIELAWPTTGESQSLGAHTALVRELRANAGENG
jgi:hypothetical protein